MCVLQRLLGCEGVKLDFTPGAVKELATMAEQLNKEVGGAQGVGHGLEHIGSHWSMLLHGCCWCTDLKLVPA